MNRVDFERTIEHYRAVVINKEREVREWTRRSGDTALQANRLLAELQAAHKQFKIHRDFGVATGMQVPDYPDPNLPRLVLTERYASDEISTPKAKLRNALFSPRTDRFVPTTEFLSRSDIVNLINLPASSWVRGNVEGPLRITRAFPESAKGKAYHCWSDAMSLELRLLLKGDCVTGFHLTPGDVIARLLSVSAKHATNKEGRPWGRALVIADYLDCVVLANNQPANPPVPGLPSHAGQAPIQTVGGNALGLVPSAPATVNYNPLAAPVHADPRAPAPANGQHLGLAGFGTAVGLPRLSFEKSAPAAISFSPAMANGFVPTRIPKIVPVGNYVSTYGSPSAPIPNATALPKVPTAIHGKAPMAKPVPSGNYVTAIHGNTPMAKPVKSNSAHYSVELKTVAPMLFVGGSSLTPGAPKPPVSSTGTPKPHYSTTPLTGAPKLGGFLTTATGPVSRDKTPVSGTPPTSTTPIGPMPTPVTSLISSDDLKMPDLPELKMPNHGKRRNPPRASSSKKQRRK